MRYLFVLWVILPSWAVAHPWHIVEASGHNHWIGLGAIGAAALAALWAKHKEKQQDEAESDEAEELEEEPA